MSVVIEGVTRRFGAAAALDDVSLMVAQGEFLALLGPSGSGKTTLLRILAGLDFPDAGRVTIAGADMAAVPARARGVGVVFQHYALFRHMSVFENVAFGLRVRPRATRPAAAEIARRVRDLLDLVQIPELAARHPEQLSGGQRQRVALARALAIEPQLLLLDEPFGALDALVRRDVRRWVRGLQGRLGLTSILVTHDQEEAMEMADRVAVMERGRLVQVGRPEALLEAPETPFVAGFLGEASRLEGEVRDGRLHIAGWGDLGAVALAPGKAQAFLRPEALRLHPDAGGAARVEGARPVGPGRWRVLARLGAQSVEGYCEAAPARGEACRLEAVSITVFGADGGRAILAPALAR